MNQYQELINNCQYLLNNFHGANSEKQYINSRLSKKAQEKFEFGYFPPEKEINSLTSLINKEILYKTNILNPNDKLFFEYHNLILPYKNVYGEIVAIVGRTILNEQLRTQLKIPKYKNTSFEKSKHLFGLYEAKTSIIKNDCVFIVEGQFDCITAQDKGLDHIVALGSANMSMDQLALICRYTKNIFLLLDNDEAGKNGRERIIKRYSKYANIVNLYLPNGYKDIDEYLSENNLNTLGFFCH